MVDAAVHAARACSGYTCSEDTRAAANNEAAGEGVCTVANATFEETVPAANDDAADTADSCVEPTKELPGGACSELALLPPQLRLRYMHLEAKIQASLLKIFACVQDDIRHNTHFLFVVGVLAGGALGMRLGACGMGFGLGVFNVPYILWLHAALAACFLVEALTASGDYVPLGLYQLGCSLFQVLDSRRIYPQEASMLTLGVMTTVSPSRNLGILIVLKHSYDAFRQIVR